MKLHGNLIKLSTELIANNTTDPVKYVMQLNENLCLNDLISKKMTISYLAEINCIRCGRRTNKSFAQGFCYPCFKEAPETEDCVLRPELCRAQEGIARDMAYAKQHCLSDHVVYLALSSGLKVGVTRQSQVPTRWIDQGAIQAVKIAITPNRYIAGLIEVQLKNYMADKTNWRNMLKNVIDSSVDLLKEKAKAKELLPDKLKAYYDDENDTITAITYPVIQYPQKINSLNLDKTPDYEGVLTGVKGQYLLFEDNTVFNVRKHNGYKVEINII